MCLGIEWVIRVSVHVHTSTHYEYPRARLSGQVTATRWPTCTCTDMHVTLASTSYCAYYAYLFKLWTMYICSILYIYIHRQECIYIHVHAYAYEYSYMLINAM